MRFIKGSIKECHPLLIKMGNGIEFECNMEGEIMLYEQDNMMVKLKKVRYLPGVKGINLS